MRKNIEINYYTGKSYDTLFPKTLGENVIGQVSQALDAKKTNNIYFNVSAYQGTNNINSLPEFNFRNYTQDIVPMFLLIITSNVPNCMCLFNIYKKKENSGQLPGNMFIISGLPIFIQNKNIGYCPSMVGSSAWGYMKMTSTLFYMSSTSTSNNIDITTLPASIQNYLVFNTSVWYNLLEIYAS